MSTIFFRRQWIVPYLFLAPALLGTIVFKLYPIFLGFLESLIYTSFGGGSEKSTFVWFDAVVRSRKILDTLCPVVPDEVIVLKISELSIWNRILKRSELTNLYNDGSGRAIY